MGKALEGPSGGSKIGKKSRKKKMGEKKIYRGTAHKIEKGTEGQ